MKIIYLLITTIFTCCLFSIFAQNNIKDNNFSNATYFNLEFDGEVYETVELENGFWQALDPEIDINSEEFKKKYLEDTGNQYIPGKSEIPYFYYVQYAEIASIIYGDLNSDKSDEAVIHFHHGFPGSSGASNTIFIFDLKNQKLEPIATIPLGSRGMGGVTTQSDECTECRGMEIKNGKLNLYIFDGTYALDWSHYRIATYELQKDGMKRTQTSKKYEVK